MSHENNPNNEYVPFSLNQHEGFDQGEAYTKLKLLVSLETYASITVDLQSLTTTEERIAMMTASIQYALLSTKVDGFRIEKYGRIMSTILPEDFHASQRQLLQASPDQARIASLELHNKQANALKQIADENDCLMGDVLTIGTHIRSLVRDQHKDGNQIIAVLSNSDKQLAILPVS